MVILVDFLIGRHARRTALLRSHVNAAAQPAAGALPKDSQNKRALACAVLLLAVPFAAVLSWKVYQRMHGIGSYWQSSVSLQSVLDLMTSPKAYQVKTLEKFLRSFVSRMQLGVIPVRFALYPAYFVALCSLVGLCVGRIRRGVALGAALSVSFWLYAASVLVTYLLLFTEAEAVGLASFRRYMNSQALACSLFTLFLLLNPDVLAEGVLPAPPARRLAPFLLALSFPILSGGISSLVSQVAGARQDAASVVAYRAQQAHLIRAVGAIGDPQATIYYIHQSISDGHYQMARLHVAPIRLNRRGFCIAASPVRAYDSYTAIKSAREWSDELAAAYAYVYLDLVDEAFASDYGALFEDAGDIASHALYQVVPPEEEGGFVCLRLLDRE